MPKGVYQRTSIHKEICRKAMLGKKLSQEWKDKISAGMKRISDDKRRALISKQSRERWQHDEHRKRVSESCAKYTGPLASQWLGGKSFEPYSPLWKKQLKERVRVRDNFNCQLCHVPELELKFSLSVHHVDYDKKNCSLNNLICLCRKCHGLTNANRNYWTGFFKKMLHASQGPSYIEQEGAV